jgi:DNA-binding response OmpR family regulator
MVEKGTASLGNVLIVDDEVLMLKTIRRILQKFGYTATVAQGGAAGIDAYVAGRFDLVVLDLSMPEINGAECFRQIRAIDADAAVLICTGYGDETQTAEMLAAGAKGILRKPFEPSALVDAVASLRRRD